MLGVILVALLSISPWLGSLFGTLLYQPAKKQKLLERESASATSCDPLSTLSKPFSGREIVKFQFVTANVVMPPRGVQLFIGGIVSLSSGEINTFTKVVDWARREAKQRLREQVAEAGFDDVINMRLEATLLTKNREKSAGVEILAYGTAIKY